MGFRPQRPSLSLPSPPPQAGLVTGFSLHTRVVKTCCVPPVALSKFCLYIDCRAVNPRISSRQDFTKPALGINSVLWSRELILSHTKREFLWLRISWTIEFSHTLLRMNQVWNITLKEHKETSVPSHMHSSQTTMGGLWLA